mmetsp:Transcript_65537/g.213397  ORF Transcript_65537/g.213397 Transcript_65537/m.213397 type:complete len:429 (-) Transcript_65537:363-1649(-)
MALPTPLVAPPVSSSSSASRRRPEEDEAVGKGAAGRAKKDVIWGPRGTSSKSVAPMANLEHGNGASTFSRSTRLAAAMMEAADTGPDGNGQVLLMVFVRAAVLPAVQFRAWFSSKPPRCCNTKDFGMRVGSSLIRSANSSARLANQGSNASRLGTKGWKDLKDRNCFRFKLGTTSSVSMPCAKRQTAAPCASPRCRCSSPRGTRMSSRQAASGSRPVAARTRSPSLPPRPRNSRKGTVSMKLRMPAVGTNVWRSGLWQADPSLAQILLSAMPADTVKPVSARTSSLIRSTRTKAASNNASPKARARGSKPSAPSASADAVMIPESWVTWPSRQCSLNRRKDPLCIPPRTLCQLPWPASARDICHLPSSNTAQPRSSDPSMPRRWRPPRSGARALRRSRRPPPRPDGTSGGRPSACAGPARPPRCRHHR